MFRVRSFRGLLPFACAGLLALFSTACAAGSAIDDLTDSSNPPGPPDTGSGTDASSGLDGMPRLGDAGADSVTSGPEGGIHDGGIEAGAETGTEGGADSGSKDSGSKDTSSSDTGAKDTGPKDTSTDTSSCVPVTLNSGANDGGTCPAPVSGTCGMADIAGFAPTWVPPSGYHQGLCAPGQIDDVYNGCFATGATELSCSTSESSEPGCFSCIFSEEGASASYGPIIDTTNGISEINQAGCIALLEPCNLKCAEQVAASFQCENTACETNCPVADDPSFTAFENCEATAAGCDPNGCDVFVTESACASELTGPTHPASICASAATFEDYYNAVVPVFCGP
jgi:hypothetical protein